MTEKDNVSMATVQMKPEYAPSEVYSTASEPPPAYKRQANSVKIAKITAFTIIVSSFILGAFILASSYLQAKASCDQVQALDSVLEKELMLETLQQVNKELPRAEALLGRENNDEVDLQNLDKEESNRKVEEKQTAAAPPMNDDENIDNDNSYSESDETDEMQKFPSKVPLELDLSDLAAALLRSNKKSRMNCVVERKHAEEIVDSPAKTVALPFGVNLKTDPKKARITGERISIFCDGGDDNKNEGRNNREETEEDADEEAQPMRPMFIPFQRYPIPFGRIPQQVPLTHMPQRMMPPVQLHPQQQQPQHQFAEPARQLPPPFQQLALRPPMPPQQMMQAPPQEMHAAHNLMMAQGPQRQPQQQTVRIHVQSVPFREIHVADDVPVQIPARQQELPQFQIQRVPLGLALERAGITPEDLRAFQRMAEERITDELKRWTPDSEVNSEESSNSDDDSDEDDSEQTIIMRQSSEEQQQQQMARAQQMVREQQMAREQQQQQMAREQQQQQMAREQQQQQQQLPQQAEQPQQTPQQQHQQQQQAQMESEEAEPRMMQAQPQRLILQPLPEQPQQQNQLTPIGRVIFGRSLAQPIRIPVPMMQAQADASEAIAAAATNEDSERPHLMQPRSV